MRLFTLAVGLLALSGAVAAQRPVAPPAFPVTFGPVQGLHASALTKVDTLLVTTYGSETTGPRSVWMIDGKPAPAPREIAYLARAGTTLVATDAIGDKIFKLDGQRNVTSTLAIERPELVPGWRVQWQPVAASGLAASPDGKFLILFTTTPQEH